MQTDGWKQGTLFTSDTLEKLDDVVYDEPTSYAGTMGRSLRMEALEINFKAENATLKYRAHVQTDGWQDWVTADGVSDHEGYVGTVGASKRMEAVQISVEGLEGYKLLYRAHVQGIGWQGWVDAEDSNSFAGTTGESRRIEALEIAFVSTEDMEYKGNGDGTHTLSYKNQLIQTSDCELGDWVIEDAVISTDNKKITRTKACELCGEGTSEKLTLAKALKEDLENDDGVVTVKSLKVNSSESVTVPAGNTLVVEGTLDTTSGGTVTNKGTIVARKISGSGITNANKNATVTVKGKYVKTPITSEYYDASAENILKDNLNLSFVTDIDIEEGSVAQTIADGTDISTDKRINLNGNTITATSLTGAMMTHKGGNLVIENAIFNGGASADFIKADSSDESTLTGTITIKNCTVKTGEYGVAVGGNIGTANAGNYDLKKFELNISDSTFNITENEGLGLLVKGNNANVNLSNVDITANGTDAACILTNNYSTGIKMNVEGGTFTANKGIVAALSNTGTYTFSGSTLKGTDGIEIEGGTLNLINGTSVTATKATVSNNQYTDSASTGTSSTGCGVQVILTKQFNNNNKDVNVNVENSTVLGTNNYGIIVLESTSNALEKNINVNLSYTHGSVIGGKLDRELIKLNASSKVATSISVTD